jgi:hypothetical protein
MRLFNLIAFAAASLCSTSMLHAQITLQQPVVRTIGVGTTVSVPDRGRMFLGGVNSAESFRQSYGPFRSGTSRGYGLSGGSMSASVYIIDLQAMDEAILNSTPDSVVMPSIRSRSSEPELDVATRQIPSAVEKAVRFERLARQAESSGRAGVAKLHWQMAAKYGSTLALDKLNPPASDATAKK